MEVDYSDRISQDSNIVGDRIREVRTVLGLSQAQFGEDLCLSHGYISTLESGQRNVNDRVIRLVGIVYGASEKWIKTGTGLMFDREANARLDHMTLIFKDLHPEFQECALEQLRELQKLQNAQDGAINDEEGLINEERTDRRANGTAKKEE